MVNFDFVPVFTLATLGALAPFLLLLLLQQLLLGLLLLLLFIRIHHGEYIVMSILILEINFRNYFGGYASEAVRCPALRAPAKTSLDCITHPVFGGSEIQRCELSCRGSSRFSAASIGGHWTTTTQCGSHTGYRWTHELQNVSLLACSGKIIPFSLLR